MRRLGGDGDGATPDGPHRAPSTELDDRIRSPDEGRRQSGPLQGGPSVGSNGTIARLRLLSCDKQILEAASDQAFCVRADDGNRTHMTSLVSSQARAASASHSRSLCSAHRSRRAGVATSSGQARSRGRSVTLTVRGERGSQLRSRRGEPGAAHGARPSRRAGIAATSVPDQAAPPSTPSSPRGCPSRRASQRTDCGTARKPGWWRTASPRSCPSSGSGTRCQA